MTVWLRAQKDISFGKHENRPTCRHAGLIQKTRIFALFRVGGKLLFFQSVHPVLQLGHEIQVHQLFVKMAFRAIEMVKADSQRCRQVVLQLRAEGIRGQIMPPFRRIMHKLVHIDRLGLVHIIFVGIPIQDGTVGPHLGARGGIARKDGELHQVIIFGRPK